MNLSFISNMLTNVKVAFVGFIKKFNIIKVLLQRQHIRKGHLCIYQERIRILPIDGVAIFSNKYSIFMGMHDFDR